MWGFDGSSSTAEIFELSSFIQKVCSFAFVFVCVRERGRERKCLCASVCVCVRLRERENVHVCEACVLSVSL